MNTHKSVNLNQLQGLLNKLEKTTAKLSKRRTRVTKSRGRPSTKIKMTTTKHKNKKCTKCKNCGCNCNKGKKSKVALIRRNPNNRILTKIVSLSNNKSNHMNRPNNHMNRPNNHMNRPNNHMNRPNNHMNRPNNHMNRPNNHTSKNIRSIVNRLISRKNPTKSHNLATLIQNMSISANNHQHNHQNNHLHNNNHQLNQLKKSKTVKSYYTTVSNGSKKMERGRRIEDDSSKPFIKVNMLDNGQLKKFQVQRH